MILDQKIAFIDLADGSIGSYGITSGQERCPFQCLPVLDETVYHCDLCGGDPQRVKSCKP